ncbi:MAG: preprotein translocase subunit SecG [Rhodobacteraceae bacterium]|nr:preprotein translocase subunit SecG [Paracoccaceae bacterium]
MENVVLIVHLLLALALIGVVLLQRSEGGGLGMGGGGGGAVSGRTAATAMSKFTWILAVAFICTSLTLTIIAARNASNSSVTDRINLDGDATEQVPGLPETDGLLPPPVENSDTTTPLVPRAD